MFQNDATGLYLALATLCAVSVFLVLWRGRRGRDSDSARWVLVDASNVMHWPDGVPRLTTIRAVADEIAGRGYVPGLVFDANAGWKLMGRYLNDADLARRLGLEARQVLVAAKGTPADPYLLQTARALGARIVTNDRYRDWAEAYPEVLTPGFLVGGGLQDGKVWLMGLDTHETVR